MSKVVFITGVSSGLGKYTAEYLVKNNYIVYGSSRNNISDENGVHILKMDVTDKDSVYNAVNTILEREGKIDVLINNTGMGVSGSIEDASSDEIRLQFDTNLIGLIYVTQAVLPSMRSSKSGMIINISSLAGICALPFQGLYSASKYAIIGLSDSLRMELKQFNIKVIVIEPGDFNTNFTLNRIIQEKAAIGNPYEAQFRETMAIIEKDENGGVHPDVFARKVLKIIKSKNPCYVYVVSSFEQRLVPYLKRLLPHKWFYAIIRSHYSIK
jgi:short-subunit dehydrogenase